MARRDLVEAAFVKSSDGGIDSPWVEFKLHDFGMRGCTTAEQSVLGGLAHLLNFRGTDTMPAAYYAQFVLNGGRPVAQSIPGAFLGACTRACQGGGSAQADPQSSSGGSCPLQPPSTA